VTFVAKTNALRRTAEEKQKEVDTLDKEIAFLPQESKVTKNHC